MIYLLSLVVDLGFAIWASLDMPWYIYILNYALLFAASSAINTSYIQGLTRGASYVSLYGVRGVPKALWLNVLTIVFMLVAYVITRFVFVRTSQYLLFFLACIALSTIVAFIDNAFQVAIERTKILEEIERE